MSAATTRPALGALLTTVDELNALPAFSILLADPDEHNHNPNDRRLALQKRPGDPGYTDYWYPAWDSDIFNALAAEEVVGRFHLGPFLVVWVPPAEPAAEAAA